MKKINFLRNYPIASISILLLTGISLYKIKSFEADDVNRQASIQKTQQSSVASESSAWIRTLKSVDSTNLKKMREDVGPTVKTGQSNNETLKKCQSALYEYAFSDSGTLVQENLDCLKEDSLKAISLAGFVNQCAGVPNSKCAANQYQLRALFLENYYRLNSIPVSKLTNTELANRLIANLMQYFKGDKNTELDQVTAEMNLRFPDDPILTKLNMVSKFMNISSPTDLQNLGGDLDREIASAPFDPDLRELKVFQIRYSPDTAKNLLAYLNKYPGDLEANYAAAELSLKNGDKSDAMARLKYVVSKNPNSAKYNLAISNLKNDSDLENQLSQFKYQPNFRFSISQLF